jgi:pSer/pThr/pTyr-binding forkhead associated (FHA) protein
MALTLAICSEGSSEMPEISFDLPRVSIGRAESCDLRLPELSVSLHHASIRQRGRDYIILDEGSANGTFVGPVRLAPQAPRVVQSGDLIRVGRIWLRVRFDAIAPTPNPHVATRDLALQLVSKHLQLQGQAALPELTVTEGQNKGAKLVLQELNHRYVLGRSISADLIIADTNASRRHAEVWRKGAQVYVRDLNSKNGSSLDGDYLYPDKTVPWSNGIVFRVGATRVVLDDPTGEALQELSAGADAHLSDEEQTSLAASLPAMAAVGETARPEQGDATAPVTVTATKPHKPRASPEAAPGRVSSADMSVAILALAVMVVSLLGLLWMLSGK